MMSLRCSRRIASRWLVLVLAPIVGACSNATGADDSDDGLCPQTSEFGNYGCTRLVALIRAPDGPLPLRMRVFLSIVPVTPNTGFSFATASATAIDTMRVQPTRMQRPPPLAGDTVTVRVVAQLVDATTSASTIVASANVVWLLRFAPVGERAHVDSIPLVLIRP